MTEKEIINIYKKYNVEASKRFGQNFLINPMVINKIINSDSVDSEEIIEIGPGLGSITKKLIEIGKPVTSYELDRDMIKVISNEISSDNFTLIEGDFLKKDISHHNKASLIANIPYYITSDIIFKLIDNFKIFKTATIMVQKEVGERLIASPGDSAFGKLTVLLGMYTTKIEKIILVPKNSFIPEPKVRSMVIKIYFKDDVDFTKKYISQFNLFVLECFMQRRKTLWNNVKKRFIKKDFIQLIKEINLTESVRPQQVSIKQYKILFEAQK
ncbi:MAG: 16S rRNA (adenine(1518)-N(6)/adenine(1519)-N(6))-dimethyltransferase RsmA [Mollicutes bacterium PWAP]|nr:16S rRNA (adenine(1518)-N(6)/adenine(1519)-N(6))-dimethyltransferase RsmA [Mollicutes bacterium PWAP]